MDEAADRVWVEEKQWTVAMAAVVAVAWLLLTFRWPASGDGQVFVWLASLVAEGTGVPYRDAFETKGPVAWMLLVPWVALFSSHAASALYVVDSLFLFGASLAASSVARRHGGQGAALTAAVLVAVVWCARTHWDVAQPDAWAGALWVGALAVSHRHRWGSAVAGGLVGLCAMIKPHYVILGILPMLEAGASVGLLRAILGVSVGGVCASLVTFAALAATGGVEAFIECQRWILSAYLVREASPSALLGATLAAFTTGHRAALITVVAGLLAKDPLPTWRVPLVASMTALVVVGMQGRNWPYHWLIFDPVLCAIAAAGASHLVPARSSGRFGLLRWSVPLILVSVLGVPALLRFRAGLSLLTVAQDDDRYALEERLFKGYGHYPGSASWIAESLAATARGQGDLLVWGFQPGLGPIHGLGAGSRFAIMRPLFDGRGTPRRVEIRQQFLRELASGKPRWLLLPAPTAEGRLEERQEWDLDAFPEARDAIGESYVLRDATAEWLVLERRGGGGSGR